MTRVLEGGCFCGEINYQITGKAVLQLMCFCSDWFSTTGTDGYAGYRVKTEEHEILQGQTSTFEKISKEGRPVIKHFMVLVVQTYGE